MYCPCRLSGHTFFGKSSCSYHSTPGQDSLKGSNSRPLGLAYLVIQILGQSGHSSPVSPSQIEFGHKKVFYR